MKDRPSEYAYSTNPNDREYLNLSGIRIPFTDVELVNRFGRMGDYIIGSMLAHENGDGEHQNPAGNPTRRLAETIDHLNQNESDGYGLYTDKGRASSEQIYRGLIGDMNSPYYQNPNGTINPIKEYYWGKTRAEDDAQQDALNRYYQQRELAEWARNLVAQGMIED